MLQYYDTRLNVQFEVVPMYSFLVLVLHPTTTRSYAKRTRRVRVYPRKEQSQCLPMILSMRRYSI
jgi:hypothetical protein